MEEFRRRPDRSDPGCGRRGRWSYCHDCERARGRTPRARELGKHSMAKHRDKMRRTNLAEMRRRERESNLKRKHGLTEQDYQTLVDAQAGLCAICGRPPTKGRGKKLCVDHDHTTGERRDLLCMECNVGIGSFGEDPNRLLKAAEYLQRHGRLTVTQPAGL